MQQFVYSAPYTGYDISTGQTFKQRMMEQRDDGTFATYTRMITVGAEGNMTNILRPWNPATINLTAERAREVVRKWNELGMTREATRSFGLENIDVEEAARQARLAEVRARRAARRAQH